MLQYTDAMLPFLVLIVGIIINLLLDYFLREKAREWVVVSTMLVIILTAITVVNSRGSEHSDLFLYEGFYVTFSLIGLLSSILVIITAWKEFRHELDIGVFFSLLLLANAGGLVVAAARNFIPLYIGYELFSITSYAMVAYMKRNRSGAEASLKIFLLGALSSAILVYGLSMYYGATGTFAFNADPLAASQSLQFAAIALIAAGSAFKIGLVPFHFWIADVYSGAPLSIVTFLAASSKKMAFAFVMQLFIVGMYSWGSSWYLLLAGLSALSILFGNIAAVMQNSVMRILAYSTIAQAGYIVIGIAAFGATDATDSQTFAMYGMITQIIAHVLMKGGILIATFVIIDNYGDASISNFKGLFHKHPFFASLIAISLFSLMGIPPTLGFLGKLFLFYAAVDTGLMWLAFVGLLGSAISIYYYGRIIRIMADKPDEDDKIPNIRVFKPIMVLLTVMSILTSILIVFAEQIAQLTTDVISGL